MMVYSIEKQAPFERGRIVENISQLLKSRHRITAADVMAHTGIQIDEAAEAMDWFIERGYAEMVVDHDRLGWLKRLVGREPNPPRVHLTPLCRLTVYQGTAKIHQTTSGRMVNKAIFQWQGSD